MEPGPAHCLRWMVRRVGCSRHADRRSPPRSEQRLGHGVVQPFEPVRPPPAAMHEAVGEVGCGEGPGHRGAGCLVVGAVGRGGVGVVVRRAEAPVPAEVIREWSGQVRPRANALPHATIPRRQQLSAVGGLTMR